MIRRLYDWTMGLAGRRRALHALGAVSFAESSFFPIPPDVLMIPMVLARREHSVCTVASVLGGLFGYAIGYFVFESVGQAVISFYGLETQVIEFQNFYGRWGASVVFIGGFTPLPYKLVTILSGAAAFDIWLFVAASLISRGLRFFIVAGLLRQFGPPIRAFIERRLNILFVLFVVLLIGGFAALRYL
jgi:membrane protein YqaA with SNARE-associated domain